MTREKIQEELGRLIYFTEVYENAEFEYKRAKNKKQRDDATHNMEKSKLAIKTIYKINNELYNLSVPNIAPENQYEYVNDSYISTRFTEDFKEYIKNIQNYLENMKG
jgi:hypothetical protein